MSTDRYDIPNIIKKIDSGKKVYKTILYPVIVESDSDIFVFAKQNDRLDLLARKYYGDVNRWWIIAHANKIKGTFFLPEDTQLVIPMDISTIMNDYMELNS
jgi:nucleoid-associated protein YgaU